ncbi:MAG: tRNA dihydrouridine synthase DusB [Candidatus Obscuribacter sp.]|jgi:tRNA-dihydrouridine synthase B|nr:tRNA dihydrouridine synthase DusB [Candidatus Obscuribacter sp.]MBK7840513.1 tRNA dihydrouridine synthase DusB [Candidatus Obscuribacter sp.]MBK9201708.1 tRNA dihydrouridine synthase DusB [Candidatus Obscuribacter sp.]MBK9620004.1 tRNA dihydrouridine synthase DusB [Candidatus Obscuribacter sp.]MBK9770529.1 tRNA dihydrouridine synthase DusB [Candidatus Obscuribacter sp.]
MTVKIGSLTLNSRVYVPPMAGVTDIVFRSIVRTIDPGCMMSTEMVSSRALLAKPESRLMDLAAGEHPIGIQIFGHEPDVMAHAAQLAEKRGADFIDINMGCPVPKITKGKDGCALMKEPELAREIISIVKQSVSVPVTVKFRLGWDDSNRNCVEFGEMAEAAGASMVTVHGRTRQQLYSGNADWANIALVKKALSIPVFGNGDVFSPEAAEKMLEITNCDGVAVARGSLGNPWLIPAITRYLDDGIMTAAPDSVERLIMAYMHCLGLINYKGTRVGVNESRRHLVNYTKGISGAAPFRNQLTQILSQADAARIMAELALVAAGKEGEQRFLLAVEQYNLKNSKHPGEGHSDREGCIQTPVDVNAILPVAVP